jgi:hypothetical protein
MEDIDRVVKSVLTPERFRVSIVGPFDEDAFDRYAA